MFSPYIYGSFKILSEKAIFFIFATNIFSDACLSFNFDCILSLYNVFIIQNSGKVSIFSFIISLFFWAQKIISLPFSILRVCFFFNAQSFSKEHTLLFFLFLLEFTALYLVFTLIKTFYFKSSFIFTIKLGEGTEIFHTLPAPPNMHSFSHYQHPPPEWYIYYS